MNEHILEVKYISPWLTLCLKCILGVVVAKSHSNFKLSLLWFPSKMFCRIFRFGCQPVSFGKPWEHGYRDLIDALIHWSIPDSVAGGGGRCWGTGALLGLWMECTWGWVPAALPSPAPVVRRCSASFCPFLSMMPCFSKAHKQERTVRQSQPFL